MKNLDQQNTIKQILANCETIAVVGFSRRQTRALKLKRPVWMWL